MDLKKAFLVSAQQQLVAPKPFVPGFQTPSVPGQQRNKPLDFLPVIPSGALALTIGTYYARKKTFYGIRNSVESTFSSIRQRIDNHNIGLNKQIDIASYIDEARNKIPFKLPSKFSIAKRFELNFVNAGLGSLQTQAKAPLDLGQFRNLQKIIAGRLAQLPGEIIPLQAKMKDYADYCKAGNSCGLLAARRARLIHEQENLGKLFRGERDGTMPEFSPLERKELRNLQRRGINELKLIKLRVDPSIYKTYLDLADKAFIAESEEKALKQLSRQLSKLDPTAHMSGKMLLNQSLIHWGVGLFAAYQLIKDLNLSLQLDGARKRTAYYPGRETARFIGRTAGSAFGALLVGRLTGPGFITNIGGGLLAGEIFSFAGDRLFAKGYDYLYPSV